MKCAGQEPGGHGRPGPSGIRTNSGCLDWKANSFSSARGEARLIQNKLSVLGSLEDDPSINPGNLNLFVFNHQTLRTSGIAEVSHGRLFM